MRSDITVGSTFPDYELPDHTNAWWRLSFLQGDDPMVLTLNRGAFCPKDRQHLQQLLPFSQQCAVGFTRLVTITAESLLESNVIVTRVGCRLDFFALRASFYKKRQEVKWEICMTIGKSLDTNKGDSSNSDGFIYPPNSRI